MNDHEYENDNGVRLGDLAGDSALSELMAREVEQVTAPLRRERDAYRKAAVRRELQLRADDAAEVDVMREADRQGNRRHLRAVDGA